MSFAGVVGVKVAGILELIAIVALMVVVALGVVVKGGGDHGADPEG